jgi:ATP-dependent DNA helicase PIF1
MLRNINQPRLCNGTRVALKISMNTVIEATILKVNYKGEDVFIPWIPLIPNNMPFDFKCLLFPVRLTFAMSINKSQDQSLSVSGINLGNLCFLDGQLYDTYSCVGIPTKLFIYAQDKKNLEWSISQSIKIINTFFLIFFLLIIYNINWLY